MAGLKVILPGENTQCPWLEVMENHNGVLYWCEQCGCVVMQDGSGLGTPGTELDTIYCPDQGRIP